MTVRVTPIEPAAYLMTPVAHIVDYMSLLEQAGRTCYKSERNIKPESADKFIARVIKLGHESVIEHCSITYRLIGSRAMSHQLVRHRIAAYSQESMRYCDYSHSDTETGLQVIVPPSYRDKGLAEEYLADCAHDYERYIRYRDAGVAAEDARFILPTGTKTEVVATFNLRQWRHTIQERGLNPHAQWEIRKIFRDILYELNHYLPIVFGDLVPATTV